MTIKIVAQDPKQYQPVDVIRLCNKIILQKGNYGSYTCKDKILTITLHLKDLPQEVNQIMAMLEDCITDFSCSPNEVNVTETFGSDEDFTITTPIDGNGEISSDSVNESESTPASESKEITEDEEKPYSEAEEISKVTETSKIEFLDEEKTDSKQMVSDLKDAVYEMFSDVDKTLTPDEFSDIVISKLHLKDHFYAKSLDGIKKVIVAYAKTQNKPKTLLKLQDLVDFTIYGPKTTKLNNVTKTIFTEQYNVNATFLEFLFYACEKCKPESLDEPVPEEVILQPPEKPPDKKVSKKPLGTPSELIQFILDLDPDMYLIEKTKKIVDFMGLEKFQKYSQKTIERLFYSILSHKETDIEKLFSIDLSLKILSTVTGSKAVLKRFIGAFFGTDANEDFVITFFKDLINNFQICYSPEKKPSPATFRFKNKNLENKVYQEPGELACFPKNDDFDSYIKKSVKHKKGNKIVKIHKILKYMKYNQCPSKEVKIIYKTCCNLILIDNLSSLDKLCTTSDKEIIEKFLNDFAKSLKPDAKFVKLYDFLWCLKKLP